MTGRPDRYRFLKPAALYGTGPAGSSGRGGFDADVVVVGAGFAGMAAAYRLVQQGRTVFVMEAMDRVGGRSWTTALSDGSSLDIGAGWTGSTQGYMLTLIKELKLETYTQYGVDDAAKELWNLFVAADGTIRPYQGQTFPVSDKAQWEIQNAIVTIDTLMQSVPLDAPWTALEAQEWDATSAGAFARQNVHDPEALAVVMTNLTTILGLSPFAVSFLHLLWDSRMAGGVQQFGAVEGGSVQFRIKGGTQQIALRIQEGLGPGRVLLNSPVRAIDQDDAGVTVISDQATVRARRAVVAIPSCLTGFIRYTPMLPPDRALLIQRVPQGSAMKVQLVYDRAFWRDATPTKLSGYTFAIDGSAVTQTLDAGGPAGTDTPGILACFIDGDAARDLGRLSKEERQSRIISDLARRFDPDKVTNLSKTITPNYVEFISQNTEWIRGDYASTPGPSVLTASGFGPAIRAPFQWIHWAGVDTANMEWYQTLDGALQSGERAANDVIGSGL